MWANVTLVSWESVSNAFDFASEFKAESETYILENLISGVILLLVYAVLGLTVYIRKGNGGGRPRCFGDAKRFLLVTAHPDDETMFFGPILLGLLSSGAQVFLLCVSPGDYYGQGAVRKKELYSACSVLGLPEGNVILLKYGVFPDDPYVNWSKPLLLDLISHYSTLLLVDVILSFDYHGVSGHANHCSLGSALSSLPQHLPPSVGVFSLESVNFIRKYSGPLDAFISLLLNSSTISYAPFSKHSVITLAMEAHSSQYVWFRKLFIQLSRYSYINTFKKVSR